MDVCVDGINSVEINISSPLPLPLSVLIVVDSPVLIAVEVVIVVVVVAGVAAEYSIGLLCADDIDVPKALIA